MYKHICINISTGHKLALHKGQSQKVPSALQGFGVYSKRQDIYAVTDIWKSRLFIFQAKKKEP